MPTYRFKCVNPEKPECQTEFYDLIFNKKEIEELICPECKGKPVVQVFVGTANIVFKGPGWTPRNPNDKNYDSTSGVRDQIKELKKQAGEYTSEDLYGTKH